MRSKRFLGRHLALASVALVWLAGCGALGQASLREGTGAGELNAPLAVGATLKPKVELQLSGTASPSLRLASTRPSVLAVEHSEVVGRAPGVAALLITTERGMVLDFYHVWVEQPTRATLQLVDAQGNDLGEARDGIDLLVGEGVYLEPRLYFDAQPLAGTIDGEWSLDAPAAEVLRQGLPNRRRVIAVAPGSARLTFESSGVSYSLAIRVLPQPRPRGESS